MKKYYLRSKAILTSFLADERYKRILFTGSSSLILRFITIGISLITVPLTLKYLGDERYGLWMSLSSVLALMAFADFGLGNSLLNAISKANGRSNIKEAQVAVSSTFFLLLGISLSLLTILYFTYPHLNMGSILKLSTATAEREANMTFIVIFGAVLINMPLGIIQRIYEGYQEGFTYQLFLLIGTIAGFFLLVFFIHLKAGLPLLVLSYSMGNVIASILGAIHLFNYKRKALLPRLRWFDLKEGKLAIKTGGIFLLLQLFSFLNLSSDNIIIAHTVGTSSIPQFEIAKKLFSISLMLVYFIAPLWPAFTEAMEKKDFAWAQKTLFNMLKYTFLIGAVATLPLVLFGKYIITLWVGPDYIPSYFLLIGFYLFTIVANFGGVMASFFNSGAFLKKQLLLVSIATTTTVVCKILFIQYFGVDWLIWANVICFTTFFILPSLQLTRRFFATRAA